MLDNVSIFRGLLFADFKHVTNVVVNQHKRDISFSALVNAVILEAEAQPKSREGLLARFEGIMALVNSNTSENMRLMLGLRESLVGREERRRQLEEREKQCGL